MSPGPFLVIKLRVICLGLGYVEDHKQINSYCHFYHKIQSANKRGMLKGPYVTDTMTGWHLNTHLEFFNHLCIIPRCFFQHEFLLLVKNGRSYGLAINDIQKLEIARNVRARNCFI